MRETKFVKVPCRCRCHKRSGVMHIKACCEDGFTLIPVLGVENEDRNFNEDLGQENGNYLNTCCLCKNEFIGNKHRVVCKLCLENVDEK